MAWTGYLYPHTWKYYILCSWFLVLMCSQNCFKNKDSTHFLDERRQCVRLDWDIFGLWKARSGSIRCLVIRICIVDSPSSTLFTWQYEVPKPDSLILFVTNVWNLSLKICCGSPRKSNLKCCLNCVTKKKKMLS